MLDAPPRRLTTAAGPAISRTGLRDHLVAATAGIVVGALAVTLRVGGGLHGSLALGVAILLVLAVPTSRLLSRRIFLSGALVFGAIPVLWWWDLPLGPVGRATGLLAGIAGGLTTAVLWKGRAEAGPRIRSLVPARALVDLVPVAAAGATAWVAHGWLTVSSGATALAALLPGWDNSAHYGMVHMMRAHGTTVTGLAGAPADEQWKFVEYPQGYHAVVATVMETLSSPELSSVEDEVVTYVNAQGWVLVLVATMIAAGLCSLPALRRRPAFAVPVAVFAVVGFVVGSEGGSFVAGFANFMVAAALTACIPLLVVTMHRVLMPVHLAALGGLLVAVAHGWFLLLVVAVPAAALVLVPVERTRRATSRTTKVLCGAVVVLTAVGMLQALQILSVLDPGEVLVIPGGILVPDLGRVLALALGAIGACLLVSRYRGGPRTAWCALVPAAGLVAAAFLGLFQLYAGGELSYYFWKLLVGVELVSAVVLALALATALPALPGRAPHGRGRLREGAAVVVLTLAATQVFGFTGTGQGRFRAADTAPTVAQHLIAAVGSTAGVPASRVTYLATPGEGALHPINAQQWFLALSGRWTVEANDDTALLVGPTGAANEPSGVLGLLLERPGAVVVLDPDQAAVLRAQATSPEITARILSW
ncbi:hypothetical protein [Actinotalea sp. K2]|uniref:hypothetical protein n=1 Tax=Actinotalea sp. K2 TaxID=2939438 RepID=UPI00201727D9|nr:hypothetical protein [Actinotalea sp. K2]MCL3862695.1 hypothetical protein [Actinotalea sp. K2]